MHRRENAKKIARLCIILVLTIVMLYSGLQILESTVFHKGQGQNDAFVSKTIVRDGVEYFPRQDITVIMVLGIDKYGPMVASGSYNNPGDADMVTLLIFDEPNERCDILYLNRDTMLEMPVLGLGGKRAGTYYGQLTLAYTYGSGLQDSCENVKETLENFLHGLTIDYYVSMNMDAIAILNDAVGGVPVTVTEDFSDVDPSITMGPYTLHGQQAITYVRTRKDVGDQKNVTRMVRQQEYVQNFMELFRNKGNDNTAFLLDTYEQISPYIVTNCSANTLSSLMERCSDYTMGQVVSPEGDNVIGDTYYEFYVDEEALDALALRLFYAKK